MPKRLPPELVDRTLSYVIPPDKWSTGIQNLHCALVCKEWAAICRPYIFHTLELDRQDRVDQLFTLLQAAPAIGTVAKCLSLSGLVGPEKGRQKRANLSWIAYAFSILSQNLPKVYSISFCHVKLSGPGDAADWANSLYPLMKTMRSVRKLEFVDVEASIAIYQELLCAFPNLDFIALCESNVVADTDGDWETSYAGVPSLQSLTIEWWNPLFIEGPHEWNPRRLSGLLPFLLTAEPHRCLRSLNLDMFQENLEDIIRFLQGLGHRLEELKLQIKTTDASTSKLLIVLLSEYNTKPTTTVIPYEPTLTSNTHLKRLTLVMPKLAEQYWQWAGTVSSTQIRQLAFHVIFGDTDFAQLASQLQRDVYAELDELTFVCLHPICGFQKASDPAIMSNVKKYIPAFRNRHDHDVLQFKDAGWEHGTELNEGATAVFDRAYSWEYIYNDQTEDGEGDEQWNIEESDDSSVEH